jgi:hypothetical protein
MLIALSCIKYQQITVLSLHTHAVNMSLAACLVVVVVCWGPLEERQDGGGGNKTRYLLSLQSRVATRYNKEELQTGCLVSCQPTRRACLEGEPAAAKNIRSQTRRARRWYDGCTAASNYTYVRLSVLRRRELLAADETHTISFRSPVICLAEVCFVLTPYALLCSAYVIVSGAYVIVSGAP